MHYLIDGHNLIARIPDIDLSDPDDEAQLILRLKRWTAADGRRRVTVYFDRGLPGGRDPHFSGGSVEVIFTSSRRTADDLLIGRIRRVNNPPEYTLVSSDREVVSAAERRGMPVLDSEKFAEQLTAEIEERQSPQPQATQKEEPLVSPDEVAQWMELFGPEPDAEQKQEAQRAARREKQERRRRRKRKPGRPADRLKDSGAQLSEDEVEEWLDIFGDDEDA
jgi:predicted RNA-binding protein with PIN domain